MSFSAPRFLELLYFVPIAAVVFFLIVRYVEKTRRPLRMSQVVRTSHVSSRFRYVRLALFFMLGCASLIVALAQPEMEQKKRREIYQKIDVVILLDNSLSMRSRDVPPSRIERAREEIHNFIAHKGNTNIGRLGLVSFAGSSVIVSYLTKDVATILFYLDYIEAEKDPSFGTDIGSGIKNAMSLIEREQGLEPTLKPDSVIFILISDGEDNGKEMRAAVAAAAEKGIRIYSVGFGSSTGGYIPMGEQDGQTVFLTDEDGKKVLATFDESTLRYVAAATRAFYYRSYTGGELYKNLNDILWRERQIIGEETVTEKTPLHYLFLVAGFAVLAIFFVN